VNVCVAPVIVVGSEGVATESQAEGSSEPLFEKHWFALPVGMARPVTVGSPAGPEASFVAVMETVVVEPAPTEAVVVAGDRLMFESVNVAETTAPDDPVASAVYDGR
jgi:hypothetical protein